MMKRYLTLLIALIAMATGTTVMAQTKDPYAVFVNDCLTFYYDENLWDVEDPIVFVIEEDGELEVEWTSETEFEVPDPNDPWGGGLIYVPYDPLDVRQIVFDESFKDYKPKNVKDWFTNLTNLQSITGTENLNTKEVTDMSYMFQDCIKLKSLDLSSWDTSNVTTMSNMFDNCRWLLSLDLSGWDTKKVTNMNEMFKNCSSLTRVYVGFKWSTEKVSPTASLFWNCILIVGEQGTEYNSNHIDKSYAHIDGGTDNPGYFRRGVETYVLKDDNGTLTFYHDNQRTNRDGSTYDMNKEPITPRWVRNDSYSIKNVVFDSSFKDARPTNTYGWFYDMRYLKQIDGIQYLNTSEVTTMMFMFNHCSELTTLDLSRFDTQNVTDMRAMFQGCNNLITIYVGEDWTTDAVTQSQSMFYNCTSLVGGAGTTFSSSHTDKEYARFDGGPSNPGYFCALKYDLMIAGTTVTSVNKSDVLGDGGSVNFDGEKTLTLNNANISTNGATTHGIRNDIPDLVVVVKGTNTVESKQNMGCFSPQNITFQGDGTLTLKGSTGGLDVSAPITKPTYVKVKACDGVHLICIGDFPRGGLSGLQVNGKYYTALSVIGENTILEAEDLSGVKGSLFDLKDLWLNGVEIISPNGAFFNTTKHAVCNISGKTITDRVIIGNPANVVTDIEQVQGSKNDVQSGNWYTLDGRKLSGKPTKKGVYLNDGKKVVVRN